MVRKSKQKPSELSAPRTLVSQNLYTRLGGRQRFVLYTQGFRKHRSADSHHTNIPLLIRLVKKKKKKDKGEGGVKT